MGKIKSGNNFADFNNIFSLIFNVLKIRKLNFRINLALEIIKN